MVAAIPNTSATPDATHRRVVLIGTEPMVSPVRPFTAM